MSDLQSDIGAGGTSSDGTVQVEMFKANGVEKKSRSVPRRKYNDGLKAPSPIGKNFVIDTNVLLHDPDCLERFGDNHICIPLEVLCELDRFKSEQTERGANARAVHRHLAGVFSDHPGTATVGIPTAGGGSIRLVPGQGTAGERNSALEQFSSLFPGQVTNDNRILLTTSLIASKNAAPTVLVTKDLNLQLKAHTVGIPCEDYQNDKVDSQIVGETAPPVIDLQPSDLQRFASTGTLESSLARIKLYPNEYALLRAGEKRTIPARMGADGLFHKLYAPDQIRIQRGTAIRPLNLGQQCFIDALLNPEASLVTCYGQAGTGKTLLAVASALHATFGGEFNGVTVSRPVIPLGDTLGFLPGSLEEKLDPWLKPIFDALEFLLTPDQSGPKRKQARNRKGVQDPAHSTAGKRCYDPLIESGLIEVEALCYIRGRSIPNRYFILDEAQQLTPLEAKTIVTRMAKGSKLVLIGDPAQIDNPYVDRLSNGLVYTRDRLRDESCSSHVTLERGERSQLAEAAATKM